jgi:glyceraldehyde 3-phosphate dehydrogenase
MAENIRIGINGFGRIGRCLFKVLARRPEVEVVGVNDLADAGDLVYLLKHDSVYGRYQEEAVYREGALELAGRRIPITSEKDPGKIPWGPRRTDVVVECSGAFRSRDEAARHLESGAAAVVISAPSDDADGTFVLGVNEEELDPGKHRVISMASCTTNCLAPVAKVLHQRFGIEHLVMSTIHAYTSSQSLTDTPARKRRRGRAAALSIVPTSTGAAQATTRVLPELQGKMEGIAYRVPVASGSICDIVATVERSVTAEEINEAFEDAADKPPLRGILGVSHEALVSQDILADSRSAIVDAENTAVLKDRVARVLAWYDNEHGYSSRLADMAVLLGRRLRA